MPNPNWTEYVRDHLRSANSDVVQELAQQLDDAYRDALSRGLPADEAFHFATQQIADWNTLAHQLEHSRRAASPKAGWSIGIGRDLMFALRMMRKEPGFTIVAVLTLALGIGANTAIFSVVNGVMLRPLTYPDGGRLVIINEQANVEGRTADMSVSWLDYQDWHAQQRSFESFGVYRGAIFNLTGGTVPERLSGGVVSSSVLDAAKLPPLLGRTFSAAEDLPAAEHVALISERLWRGRFSASPSVINQTLTLDGAPYTIVGVMQDGMRLPSRLTDVWLPIGLYVNRMPSMRDNHPGLLVIGRLKQDVTFEQARSDMQTIARRIGQQFPDTNSQTTANLQTLYERVVGDIRGTLLALLGAVGFVLLIACVNLANMTLARGEARIRELVVRSALGASRARLVRQLLTESLVLSITGTIAGIALAAAAVRVLVNSQPSTIPRLDQVGIDPVVLAFSSGISIAVAMLFGLWPALRITSRKAALSLGDLSSTSSARSKLRSILVTVEISLAMVLLVGASLTIRTFSAMARVELGFRPENVMTMYVNLPARNYPQARWMEFHRNLLARLSALPGVETASISSSTPLGGNAAESGIVQEGAVIDMQHPGPGCVYGMISGQYFKAMGIELVKGRSFTETDSATSPPVIVLDEASANAFWPGQDPIGRRVAFEFRGTSPADPQPIWRQVVGVVRTVRQYDLTTPSLRAQAYIPYGQPALWFQNMPTMTLTLRTSADTSVIIAGIRQEVKALDPAVPVFGIRTMTQYVDSALEQPRLSMALMSVFGGLALLLAAIGVYGVLSYSISRRTREIGVRIALGATPTNILGLVMRQGAIVSMIGVAIGLGLSAFAMRAVKGMLYGVQPTDTATYLITPAMLLLVAMGATFIPARRATEIDPLRALRHD